jgi:hypothetical protein
VGNANALGGAIPNVLMNLDGRVVKIGARAWQIHLFGTRTVECQRWVRVALLGRPSYSVLLKMTVTAAASEAIHALEWWLVSPGHENGDVIEVL